MRQLIVTRDTEASPEKVWTIISNLENAATTISAIKSVERLDEGTTFGVGTKWRETRTMFGKEATEEMVVTEFDEGRSYVTEARSHGAFYRSAMSVEPTPSGGSRISMAFDAEPERRVAKVFAFTLGRFFERATRKAFEGDLADITAAAEAAG